MADDPTNPFAEILGALKSKGDSQSTSGTRKGVRKDGADKVKPVLSSTEVQRLTNVFKILKGVLFPGPEAKRIATTNKKAFPGMAATVAATPKLAKDGPGIGIKTVIAAAIAALVSYITATFNDVQEFFLKTGLKVIRFFKPITNMLKVVGKTATKAFAGLVKAIKPVANIVNSIAKFFKGMTASIKSSPLVGKLLKSGKGIFAAIKTAGAKVGAKFLKFGRFIPVLGSLFSFGFAYKDFKDGDYVGGTLNLVSGILNLLPFGATNIASMVIDGYLLTREFAGEFKEGEKGTLSGEGNMLKTMAGKIGTWISGKIYNLPVIGGIMKLGKAAILLSGGNWSEGFKMLGWGMLGLMPGATTLALTAAKGFSFVMGLFESKGEVDPPELPETSSFGEIMGDLFQMVGNVLSNVWEGMLNFVNEWVTSIKQNVLAGVQKGVDWIREKTGMGFDFVDNILADSQISRDVNSSNGSSPTVGVSNSYMNEMKTLDVERNRLLGRVISELSIIKDKLLNPDGEIKLNNNNTLIDAFNAQQ